MLTVAREDLSDQFAATRATDLATRADATLAQAEDLHGRLRDRGVL